MHLLPALRVAPLGAFLLLLPCLLAADAHALERCTAKMHPKSGSLRASARGVDGPLTWGSAAGKEIRSVSDPRCVRSGVARRCELPGASAPADCILFLADDTANCTATIRGCTPGTPGAETSATAALDIPPSLNPLVLIADKGLLSPLFSIAMNHVMASLGIGQYYGEFDELRKSMLGLHDQIAAMQTELDHRLAGIADTVDRILRKEITDDIEHIRDLLRDSTTCEEFLLDILKKGDVTTPEQLAEKVNANNTLKQRLGVLEDDLSALNVPGFWNTLFDNMESAYNKGFDPNDPYNKLFVRTWRANYASQLFTLYQTMLASLAQVDDVYRRVTIVNTIEPVDKSRAAADYGLLDTIPKLIKDNRDSLTAAFVRHVGWSIPGAITFARPHQLTSTQVAVVLPYLSKPSLIDDFKKGRGGYKAHEDLVDEVDVPYAVDPDACNDNESTDACLYLRAWESHMQSLVQFDDWLIGDTHLQSVLQLYGQVPGFSALPLSDILMPCPAGVHKATDCTFFEMREGVPPPRFLLAQNAAILAPDKINLVDRPRDSAMILDRSSDLTTQRLDIQDFANKMGIGNSWTNTKESWGNLNLTCYPGVQGIGNPMPPRINVYPAYFQFYDSRYGAHLRDGVVRPFKLNTPAGYSEIDFADIPYTTHTRYDDIKLHCEGDWTYLKSGYPFWAREAKFPSEIGRLMNFFTVSFYDMRPLKGAPDQVVATKLDLPVTDTTLATGLTPVHTCPKVSTEGEPFVGATYTDYVSLNPPSTLTCNYGGDSAHPASRYMFTDAASIDPEVSTDGVVHRPAATWLHPYSKGWSPSFTARGETAKVNFGACTLVSSPTNATRVCECTSDDPADCRFIDLTNSVDVRDYSSGVPNSPLPLPLPPKS